MSLNYERAVDLLARIEIENLNGRWNQTEWGRIAVPEGMDLIIDGKTGLPVGAGSCQTGMCAAGWACILSGVKKNRLSWDDVDYENGMKIFAAEHTLGGEYVPRVAWSWLGLGDGEWITGEEYPSLFDADNDMDDLYGHMTDLMPEPDEPRLRADVQARVVTMQEEAITKKT